MAAFKYGLSTARGVVPTKWVRYQTIIIIWGVVCACVHACACVRMCVCVWGGGGGVGEETAHASHPKAKLHPWCGL